MAATIRTTARSITSLFPDANIFFTEPEEESKKSARCLALLTALQDTNTGRPVGALPGVGPGRKGWGEALLPPVGSDRDQQLMWGPFEPSPPWGFAPQHTTACLAPPPTPPLLLFFSPSQLVLSKKTKNSRSQKNEKNVF